MAAFEKLREHRNKLTHFFHPSLDNRVQKHRIAGEMQVAWFHLRAIIQNAEWSAVFATESGRTSAIDVQLQALRGYFKTVFETQVKPMRGSSEFGKCPSCGYPALDTNAGDSYIDNLCRVCEYAQQSHRAIAEGEDREVKGYCLSCGCEDCVEPNGYGYRCTECDETFEKFTKCDCCQASFASSEDPDAGSYQWGCPFCPG